MSEMNDSITMGNGPRVHFQDDFDSDISDEDPRRLMDTTFHFSAPVVPSDVNEDGDSDESHPSPRTPEDGEEIPLSVPSPVPLETTVQELFVSRTSSSRPCPCRFPSPDSLPDPLLNNQIQVHFSLVSPTGHPSLMTAVTPVSAPSPKVRFRLRDLQRRSTSRNALTISDVSMAA